MNVLVDTGASLSVFPLQAAEHAELDRPRFSNLWIQYGSERVPAYRVKCFVVLFGRRLEIDVAFVERLDAPFGLLGRKTVFNRFTEVAFSEGRPDAHMRFEWQ